MNKKLQYDMWFLEYNIDITGLSTAYKKCHEM